MKRRALRSEAGFTLLEVLVAFTILCVAVVAVIQGFAAGLRLLRAAGEQQTAVLIADQKAREVIIPLEGREEGKEGSFDWERTISIVSAPDLTRTPASAKWHVFQIDVTVRWGDKRRLEVVTLRTSAEKAPPFGVPK
jgi:general secretion pathway protein I